MENISMYKPYKQSSTDRMPDISYAQIFLSLYILFIFFKMNTKDVDGEKNQQIMI